MTEPFRLKLESACIRPPDECMRNAFENQGWPRIQPPKIAIVGGAPSVADHLDELREWDGHIWAVNYMSAWLRERGIASTMITIDPQDFDPGDVPEAILATVCSPALFQRLSSRGTRIRSFDLSETHENGVFGGITTARRAMSLSLQIGYRDVSIFGCDSSYPSLERSNVDRQAAEDRRLIIRAAGLDFLSEPGMVLQAQEISLIIRTFGVIFKNRSSGLLAAMIQDPDGWECVGVSVSLKEHLEAVNGPQGLYDQPFNRETVRPKAEAQA